MPPILVGTGVMQHNVPGAEAMLGLKTMLLSTMDWMITGLWTIPHTACSITTEISSQCTLELLRDLRLQICIRSVTSASKAWTLLMTWNTAICRSLHKPKSSALDERFYQCARRATNSRWRRNTLTELVHARLWSSRPANWLLSFEMENIRRSDSHYCLDTSRLTAS